MAGRELGGTIRSGAVKRTGKRRSVHSKQRRLREWLWWAWQQLEPFCEYCGEAIPVDAVLAGDASDGILIHHEDEDRANNSPKNLKLMHRGCHRTYHSEKEAV